REPDPESVRSEMTLSPLDQRLADMRNEPGPLVFGIILKQHFGKLLDCNGVKLARVFFPAVASRVPLK
ncbi:hypothetical protein ACFL4G_08130, partial [Thermodesulfobacteriota bacterium]